MTGLEYLFYILNGQCHKGVPQTFPDTEDRTTRPSQYSLTRIIFLNKIFSFMYLERHFSMSFSNEFFRTSEPVSSFRNNNNYNPSRRTTHKLLRPLYYKHKGLAIVIALGDSANLLFARWRSKFFEQPSIGFDHESHLKGLGNCYPIPHRGLLGQGTP